VAKILRWLGPLAASAGLLAAGALPPAQAASSAYAIAIGVKTHMAPVTGYSLVAYRYGKYATAAISGTVSGAASGDVTTLLAEPFGTKAFSPVGAPITITQPSQGYSFSVSPSLATKYEAQVTTGQTVDGTSPIKIIYVMLYGAASGPAKCSATECVMRWKSYTAVPASAYKAETAKRDYLYLGVRRSNGRVSSVPPRYLTLSPISTATRPRRISSTRYEQVLTFRIPLDGKKNATWWPASCTKNTESEDGIGLPGHHDCGDRRVRWSQWYLG
jgi:hypothetical protein